ncbi:Sec-independent protein translocase protein TatB [Lichenicola sp.]|uniref:Sec-independent protein translocase protein TatB n=1 Tax=Lichenicola sp. TaxID=2804529 RepID=UPI003AFFC25F
MFDFAWSEIALIGVVALLFIGPKDMPVAIRTITNLLKKGRKLAGEFQTHVDEMVREADFGEARDQLRQLRSFNVRGQIMKALDEDGSLKRTLQQKPFDNVPAGPRIAPPTQSTPTDAPVMLPLAEPLNGDTIQARPVLGTPTSGRSWITARAVPEPSAEDETLIAADPAPSILPPQIARRLRIERSQPLPPSFVPPRPVHPRAVRGA